MTSGRPSDDKTHATSGSDALPSDGAVNTRLVESGKSVGMEERGVTPSVLPSSKEEVMSHHSDDEFVIVRGIIEGSISEEPFNNRVEAEQFIKEMREGLGEFADEAKFEIVNLEEVPVEVLTEHVAEEVRNITISQLSEADLPGTVTLHPAIEADLKEIHQRKGFRCFVPDLSVVKDLPPLEYLGIRVHDVMIPYPKRASHSVTDATGGTEPVHMLPDYMRAYLRGDFEEGDRLLLVESLREARRQMAFCVRVYQCKICVSASVPPGFFALDGHCVILNEDEAETYAWDADGDTAMLAFNEDKSHAVVIKFPITRKPPALTRLNESLMKDMFGGPVVKEVFHDRKTMRRNMRALLEEEIEAAKSYNQDEFFEETHTPVPVGLFTSKWDTYEMEKLAQLIQQGTPMEEALEVLRANPQRFLDIEKPMKARSKGKATQLEGNNEILDYPNEMVPEHSWAFTSVNGLRRRTYDDLAFLLDEDAGLLFQELSTGQCRFRPVEQRGGRTRRSWRVMQGAPVDEFAVERAEKLGRIHVVAFPQQRPGLPPACLIWLTLPDGTPVAFTESRRGGEHRGGQLGYLWVIYPELRPQENGQVDILTPLESLSEYVADNFDSAIMNPQTGNLASFFPSVPNSRYAKGWTDPFDRYPHKARALQATIAEWLSKHGDMIPAERDPSGQLQPLKFAEAVAPLTVLVDYQSENLSVDEMKHLVHYASKAAGGLAYAGGKGNNQRYRKYLHARPNGTPLTSSETANPKRAANQRSQMLRAMSKHKMLVAVVSMETKTGVLITKHGVEEQEKHPGCFLPTILPEAEENFKPKAYPVWGSDTRVVWIGDAKRTCKVGKLLDVEGMKFVPRRYSSAKVLGYEDTAVKQEDGKWVNTAPYAGRDVDLIVPMHEVAKKGAMRAWTKNAIEGTILVHGEEVPCYLVERNLLRSGCASENDPARVRRAQLRGCDGLAIQHAASKIGIFNDQKPDFRVAMVYIKKVRERRINANNGVPSGIESVDAAR